MQLPKAGSTWAGWTELLAHSGQWSRNLAGGDDKNPFQLRVEQV